MRTETDRNGQEWTWNGKTSWQATNTLTHTHICVVFVELESQEKHLVDDENHGNINDAETRLDRTRESSEVVARWRGDKQEEQDGEEEEENEADENEGTSPKTQTQTWKERELNRQWSKELRSNWEGNGESKREEN